MSCTVNAKISDSGYTNTCDHSQSQRSSGSSLSKNSHRSQSSGYCGGNPSIFHSSSGDAFPKPITKKKGKDNNKKKSESLMTVYNNGTSAKVESQQTNTGLYTSLTANTLNPGFHQSGVNTVELVDATDPAENNGNSNFNTTKEGPGYQTDCSNNNRPNCNREAFGAVVSLHDGLVLHATASLSSTLGYSKDAWLGESFIDYIHPKDKAVFFDKLASCVVLPFGNHSKDFTKRQTSLFCSLRRYSEVLLSENNEMNFGELADPDTICVPNAIYISFHLHLSLKRYEECDSQGKPGIMFLVITAEPVFPVYKVPGETIVSSVFSTRHTVTGHLSHVDDDVVQYFGYLPQDMLGCWSFSYYHPADLPYIKDIYKTVVQLDGSSFKSKPYRFAVKNGGYVLLETEWSSFINPWKKKLEFVEGHHKVLRGPENPDVFQQPDIQLLKSLANMSEESMKQSRIIQNEICALLNKEILISASVNAHDMDRKTTDLITSMENMIQDVNRQATAMKISKMPTEVAGDSSFSEHDSVMLGEISPHHEYCDSKSSSEIPPSYNQLNYNEKLERYFNSKPLLSTIYDNTRENVNLTALSNDGSIKYSSNETPSSHKIQNHDGSGSGSNENSSSDTNNRTSSTSRDDSINGNSNIMVPDNFQSVTLTTTLLNKHNQEMEKLMVRKHKERRTGIKKTELNKETTITPHGQEEAVIKEQVTQLQLRGRKRRNSYNREKKINKIPKYDGTEKNCDKNIHLAATGNNTIDYNSLTKNLRQNINMWPQTSISSTLQWLTQNATQRSSFSHTTPIYYLPESQPRENMMNTVASQQHPNRFFALSSAQSTPHGTIVAVPSITGMYSPIIDVSASSSMIYVTPMISDVSTVQNQRTQFLEVVGQPNTIDDVERPASQVTSTKVEPGSVRAMSESSKKLMSPASRFSPCVSVDYGCFSLAGMPAPVDDTTRACQIESSLEDSSDSSFYGGFLNTSCGSSCNTDQIIGPKKNETTHRAEIKPQKVIPKGYADFKMNHQLQQDRIVHSAPPCLQGVKMTPEIIYRYQMSPKILTEVLQADRDNLKHLHQPMLVNDQLDQLYLDLELDGFGTKLIMDDSHRFSDEDDISADATHQKSPQMNSRCINV